MPSVKFLVTIFVIIGIIVVVGVVFSISSRSGFPTGNNEKPNTIIRQVFLNNSTHIDTPYIKGPYYPQSEALMYIFKVNNYEWLNQCGRIFLKRTQEEGVKISPVRYEVAVTPEEFWGK